MLKEIVADTWRRKEITKSQGLYQSKFKDTFWITGYVLFVLAKKGFLLAMEFSSYCRLWLTFVATIKTYSLTSIKRPPFIKRPLSKVPIHLSVKCYI